ncbi:N-acetylmuramoyl-L-alanine amidase [Rhizobium sp. FKY42]|uniref:N-acetylmuramoyl-L-alanine amidase n=1 Tax=Rhizobium sp. FKY42 TaxID=2562310 RepID=UPI0010BFF8F8|nr:N-acetylmuramoyl-L-alanine amidase [Rhizobium sp. FKY42]
MCRRAVGAGSVFTLLSRLLFALFLLCPVSVPATEKADEPLLAFSARIVGDDARSRVVVDFDDKPEFSVHYVASPERIVIDLPATAFGFPAEDLSARGLFKDIRYGTMGEGSARIVLTAQRPVKLVAAEVQKNEDRGFRLVLDAEITTREKFAELVRTQNWKNAEVKQSATIGGLPDGTTAKDGVFTIAIDAGHGGIDAGASGAVTKTPEKDITLAFAKILVEKLNTQSGIQAFLTRSNDSFLSLSERVVLARQGKADLFISLHADTLGQKNIRGSTVYTLSDTASDKMAAALAARENLSDQLAGYSIEVPQPEIADILLDLTRRETQAFSISLANRVVKSFEGQIGLINNPHRFAGFQVLRAPDIPSILLELGFLSNEGDEKLLLSEEWRDKVTSLLVDAVLKYRGETVAGGG